MGKRLKWLLGVWAAWSIAWFVLGVRMAILAGKSPHPFLPEMEITGALRYAILEWAFHALLANLVMGLILGLGAYLIFQIGDKVSAASWLSFKRGHALGWGGFFWFHSFLFLVAPGTITTFVVIRRLPIGAVILMFALVGWFLTQAAFKEHAKPGMRSLFAGVFAGALLLIPHDAFRRWMPASPPIDPKASRVVLVGVDGLRADVVKRTRPDWTPPSHVKAICVVPATRLSWNILLGADPDSFSAAGVIPFRSEWAGLYPLVVLERMKSKGIRSAFIIDDSTTLSFGLKPSPFSEVLEPDGGWKHFFTMGMASTWPAYSWCENYVSPVETTNPWSDLDAYFRDIERLISRNQFVASHCVQLHVPFYVNFKELQQLRPWIWLAHAAKSYEPYQTPFQAQRDHYSRSDGRCNPVNHYRVRAERVLASFDEAQKRWVSKFPNLSGVLTADHGELHVPIFNGGPTNVGFLTGIHGFSLEPDTVYVPLHTFGSVQNQLPEGQIFSWLDLRDCLFSWSNAQGPLVLTIKAPAPWLVQFQAVQATHLLPPELQKSGIQGAGLTPAQLAGWTVLTKEGIWYMDDFRGIKREGQVFSTALVYPDKMVTWNPLGEGRWIRQEWKDYQEASAELLDEGAKNREIALFSGKRPKPLR